MPAEIADGIIGVAAPVKERICVKGEPAFLEGHVPAAGLAPGQFVAGAPLMQT